MVVGDALSQAAALSFEHDAVVAPLPVPEQGHVSGVAFPPRLPLVPSIQAKVISVSHLPFTGAAPTTDTETDSDASGPTLFLQMRVKVVLAVSAGERFV